MGLLAFEKACTQLCSSLRKSLALSGLLTSIGFDELYERAKTSFLGCGVPSDHGLGRCGHKS
jgi:hypothetical protein